MREHLKILDQIYLHYSAFNGTYPDNFTGLKCITAYWLHFIRWNNRTLLILSKWLTWWFINQEKKNGVIKLVDNNMNKHLLQVTYQDQVPNLWIIYIPQKFCFMNQCWDAHPQYCAFQKPSFLMEEKVLYTSNTNI